MHVATSEEIWAQYRHLDQKVALQAQAHLVASGIASSTSQMPTPHQIRDMINASVASAFTSYGY